MIGFLIAVALAGGELRWGADPEGGAPFIFPDPQNPKVLIGYEVDIMRALADETGRKEVFVQGQWESLIPGLQRGDYDLAVNGLEITEVRKREVAFSDPYYIGYLQLTVRADETTVHNLADLKGQKVGTLKGTLAQTVLEATKNIEPVTYDSQVTTYEDLALGRTRAVLQDWPIALYFGSPNRKLKNVGEPIERMLYGIGMRKGDGALTQEVNQALVRLWKKGKMREIYERWGLWTPQLAREFPQSEGEVRSTPPTAYQAYLKGIGAERTWRDKLAQYWTIAPLLLDGAWVTLQVSVASMTLAMLLGLAIALSRLYGPTPLSSLAVGYIEVMRGTPLLIQLYILFFGLPNIGIKLSPMMAGILGLGLNYAACEAENYRAGIISIPKSQLEAAFALGMSKFQAIRHIVLPQAIRVSIPPVTNDFIALLKDSSLVSLVTMVELSKVYYQLAATYYDYLGIGVVVAAIYFVVGWPFVRLSRRLERRFGRGQAITAG